MKLRNVVIASLLLASGCAHDPLQLDAERAPSEARVQVRTAVGDTFRIRVGEVAAVDGSDLLIGFRGVRSDSRCPVDVTCVWAGDAEVALGVAREGDTWAWHSLHTTVDPRQVVVDGFTIALIDLAPQARSRGPIEAREYVATLRVTRQ